MFLLKSTVNKTIVTKNALVIVLIQTKQKKNSQKITKKNTIIAIAGINVQPTLQQSHCIITNTQESSESNTECNMKKMSTAFPCENGIQKPGQAYKKEWNNNKKAKCVGTRKSDN